MTLKFLRPEKNQRLLLWLAVVMYAAGFTAFCWWKYSNFFYDNLDLAIYNQVFLNTLHGNFFASTIHPPTYLADHFELGILALLPFYALRPGPQILLLLQSVIIALTALPIYALARTWFKQNSWLPLLASVLWLLNPQVHNMNFFEFHLLPLAVLLLLWAFYFYARQRYAPFVILVAASMLVREDVAFIVLMFSAIAWWEKKSLGWKLAPLLLAVSYGLVSFSLIAALSPIGSYKFLSLYGWLGGSDALSIATSFLTHPLTVINHLLTFTNLEFILGLTFPFFFLVFTKSKYWLLLIPPAAQIMLGADGGSALILETHYAGYFLLGLFPLMLIGWVKIRNGQWPRWLPQVLRHQRAIMALTAAATVYAGLTYGSIVPALTARALQRSALDKQRLTETIPSQASVAATFEFLTTLSSREKIYSLHYAYIGTLQYAKTTYRLPADTEYLVIDWEEMLKNQMHFNKHHTWGPYAKYLPSNLAAILKDFNLRQASGALNLWQRAENGRPAANPLVSFEAATTTKNSPDPIMLSGGDQPLGLATSWLLPPASNDQHYYIEVATAERVFDLPLAYGLEPDGTAVGPQTATMLIPLNSGETEITLKLMRWSQSYLKLGGLKNLEAISDARPVSPPITIQRGKW